MREVGVLIQETRAADVWVFDGGLDPPGSATVVRLLNDDLLVTDGAYLETKEHVGGFLIIEVSDHRAALDWARKLARVITLPIEVRRFQDQESR